MSALPVRLATAAAGGVAVFAAVALPAGSTTLTGEPPAGDTVSVEERTVQPAVEERTEIAWEDLEPGDVVPYEAYVAAVGEPEAVVLPALARQKARITGPRITVPALKAALPVVRSEVKNGVMDVPPGITAAGWLATTKPPGAKRGVTVLATHRDTGGGGRGTKSPLYDAEYLSPGQKIAVRWGGETTRYKVTRITWHDRNRLPARMLDTGGHHRMVLVTCGGALVMGKDGRLHWSKRALVWAKAR